MPHQNNHRHLRKRVYKNLEPYPHPDPLKRILDHLIYIVGVLGPIMTLPQVYKIWIENETIGLSMVTWVTYLLSAIIWLAYAIVHKEKPLILTYSIWVVMDLLVVGGILTQSPV